MILDLRKAYLQVHIEKSLWLYQTVVIQGKKYCLTHLGFGLNKASLIMKSIVEAILSQEDKVKEVTSTFNDDIFVNDSVATTTI